ncbi:hypothetical protein [Priestia megaterium]|uniref:hypothetical protein n=1 Tax=Priestia megaterium TaxID=1404 RepID=UPI0011AB0F63|nr:hypothetical protein [Priestia megaterium]
MTTKITIDRYKLKMDFENTLMALERAIVHRNETNACFSLGVLYAITVYSGMKLEDKLRYVSMVRLMNEAFDNEKCTNVECQFGENINCKYCNKDEDETDEE